MVNGLKEFTWFTAYLELISIEKNSIGFHIRQRITFDTVGMVRAACNKVFKIISVDIGFDLSYYTIYLVENARLLRKFKANMKIFFQNQIGVKFFPGFRGKAFK